MRGVVSWFASRRVGVDRLDALLDLEEAAGRLLEVAQEFPREYRRHVYELLGEPLARVADSHDPRPQGGSRS